MRIVSLLAVASALALGLFADKPPSPSAIAVICASGTALDGNCLASTVDFTGTNYSKKVRVVVTEDSTGAVVDDAVYSTDANGDLLFEETLFPGSYTVSVGNGKNVVTATVTVEP